MSSISQIGPIPKKWVIFCYVPEDEIKGGILGWNPYYGDGGEEGFIMACDTCTLDFVCTDDKLLCARAVVV